MTITRKQARVIALSVIMITAMIGGSTAVGGATASDRSSNSVHVDAD